jgi:hypothetical protein
MRLPNLIGGLLVALIPAATAAPPDCVTEKYQAYAQAQRAWQHGLTQLLVEAAPEYEDVAWRYLEDQLRSIELRKLEVAFFAHAEPEKLRTQMPLNSWVSLSVADRQRIASESERYAQLREQARVARSRPPHPDGADLREVMKSDVMTSQAYQRLLQSFLASVKAAEAIEC